MQILTQAVRRKLDNLNRVSLSGGGVTCFSYVGMLRFITTFHEDWVANVKECSCCSAGCLAGLLITCNISDYSCLKSHLKEYDNIIERTDLHALYKDFGLDKGSRLRSIIKSVFSICALHDQLTFNQLFRLTSKVFTCVATNLTTRSGVYMNHMSHPDMLVADAVYMSMSIPLLIQPIIRDGNVFVDGCIAGTIPLTSSKHETLYVGVGTPESSAGQREWSLHTHLVSLLFTVIATQLTSTDVPDECSLRIETDMESADVRITTDILDVLEHDGFASAFTFFLPDVTIYLGMVASAIVEHAILSSSCLSEHVD